ncbi:hypothetical protein COCVIDRAFT_112914 [Bipolaris victoriae FI3]|uniref:Uncharacterized protein n=2 Tax=Bipolaris TaxID=33194 RepID=W6XUN0_COCC2|nr:uncharacterized protein COCCADRAFT_107917 [Bipolaris zeicola 26-R-13]XP_014551433.1 hypothetical protein COCVIDRAFT_112914 [Bipolaris victoriae FI3]EUC28905.1 hypothetical protein COCCADRAFT_107917 [Bipolaris zeicola 26-R-13]
MRAGDIIDSACRRATTIYCIFRPSAIFHPPARHPYPIPNATKIAPHATPVISRETPDLPHRAARHVRMAGQPTLKLRRMAVRNMGASMLEPFKQGCPSEAVDRSNKSPPSRDSSKRALIVLIVDYQCPGPILGPVTI